ncbi:tetratricopeptide repeat protein, partial [Ralstonia pseudosolanacearum]|uniref:tetratricopeptide repeat protein n=1 Tax=Ralstonia pseudosolanacearum TaxID=1310165 RepID=UPI003D187442
MEFDPGNEGLKSGLADAQSAARRSSSSSSLPFGNIFQGPELWAKLSADPTTRGYLQQPDFVKMIQDLQRNPGSFNLYLKDQRMMNALGVLLNVPMRGGEDEMEVERNAPEVVGEEPKRKTEEVKKREPEPEPMAVPDEEKEVRERKVQAQKEKDLGNAAYKKQEFEKAIDHYSKAIELDDGDISFITNRAAVYLEI